MVTERYRALLDRLAALCAAEDALRTVLLFGSQSRAAQPADEYSDLDLLVSCAAPERLLDDDALLRQLGGIVYSFVEESVAGQQERRVLFDGGLDVDLLVVRPPFLRAALAEHTLDGLLARGCRVLYDADGVRLPPFPRPARPAATEAAFRELVQNFFFHTVWAEKKLRRGELWTAKMCVDGYMKGLLLRMIELYEGCVRGADYDVWHGGRMLERWAEPDVVRALGACFARYDAADVCAALAETTTLFTRLATAYARRGGFYTGVPVVDGAAKTE